MSAAIVTLPLADDAAAIPTLDAAIKAACKRIAPLWPLSTFVAVNPYLGFTDQRFADTAATLKRVAQTRMLMPRAFYRDAIAEGLIDAESLAAALDRLAGTPGLPTGAEALAAAAGTAPAPEARPPGVIATVAEILDRLAGGDRQASLVAFMIDALSSWCAGYFDQGQANWRMPVRNLRPYAAWRAMARHDRGPEVIGVTGFRRSVASLPDDATATIAAVVERLGIPGPAVEDYLHRSLFDIAGWAGYARYLGWQAELEGGSDDTLVELLAIRLAWAYGLFAARTDAPFREAWTAALAEAAAAMPARTPAIDRDLAIDLALQEAFDIAHQKRLASRLVAHVSGRPAAVTPLRKAIQAAFCIDVRSEVFRRAFETVAPQAETIGFAGFFGFPIEYVPIGQVKGGAQCPVLLKPAFIVCEAVGNAGEEEETEVLGLRLMRRRAARAWKAFKVSAVSSFSYVETAGLTFAGKILSDSFGLTRPVTHPSTDGLDAAIAKRVGPRLDARMVGGRSTGFTPDQRVAMAEAVLKAMSMTRDFARLVVLAGHGSTTVNNPHAAGLDCGACGGHTGEANARVAAAILNDAGVRAGLVAKGIDIPADTWFVGALHDTTTDEVTLYDREAIPASHAEDLRRLEALLAQAGSLARLERATMLGIAQSAGSDAAVLARSRDWSQVRPEWGLAGNAAFIAAPRDRTRGLDLAGRSFLHEYDHRLDSEYGVLELIMTAPMVVASWINLQYFGSTVNNRAFGSGNKVLHNIVGQIGVLEGNGGDLKTGLPLQSVHDGQRFVHEPLRLAVYIEAPLPAIERVLARHAGVRDLVEKGWVFLHALADEGRTVLRYAEGRWEAVAKA